MDSYPATASGPNTDDSDDTESLSDHDDHVITIDSTDDDLDEDDSVRTDDFTPETETDTQSTVESLTDDLGTEANSEQSTQENSVETGTQNIDEYSTAENSGTTLESTHTRDNSSAPTRNPTTTAENSNTTTVVTVSNVLSTENSITSSAIASNTTENSNISIAEYSRGITSNPTDRTTENSARTAMQSISGGNWYISASQVPSTSHAIPFTGNISITSPTNVIVSPNVVINNPSTNTHVNNRTTTSDNSRTSLHNDNRQASGSGLQQPTSPHGSSQENFKPAKKRKLNSESPVKSSSSDDDQGCPICLEEWTTTGTHRLVALKCGHLFGQKCIEKWLKNKKSCPQCNARARCSQIRCLYANKIKALDTSERDEALKNLEKERTLRGIAEMQTAEIRLQNQLRLDEVNRLKIELELYKSVSTSVISPTQVQTRPHDSTSNSSLYKLEHSLTINETGACRVLAYCPSLATLVISQVSKNPIFPGYGFKKLSCLDFRKSENITFHSKPIRDACFNPCRDDSLLLSCSVDKTLKLTNLRTNNILHTYTAPHPVWSCAYNADNENIFYAGLQNGTVLEYDLRNTVDFTQKLFTNGNTTPIVSLQYVPSDLNSTFRPGGLLVGQLSRITFYEKMSNEFRPHFIPLEGPLTSLRFEPTSRHFLASFRPTQQFRTSRHVVCELTCHTSCPTSVNNPISSNIVHTFNHAPVQKLLSRSAIVASGQNNERLTVFSSDESDHSVSIWDVNTQRNIQTLSKHDTPVLDICPFSHANKLYLATLCDKTLHIYSASS